MKVLGIRGENFAAKFLKKIGYKIIARNYKTPIGEIDIVAQDGNTIVFVEVKTRADNFFGQPFEAVNNRKRQKLRKLGLLYLKRQKRELPARFDVLSIICSHNGKKEIEHIKDAFEG
jgi:putative endonuclease